MTFLISSTTVCKSLSRTFTPTTTLRLVSSRDIFAAPFLYETLATSLRGIFPPLGKSIKRFCRLSIFFLCDLSNRKTKSNFFSPSKILPAV